MRTGGAVLLLRWHLVLQGRLTCACSFSSVLKMEHLLLLFVLGFSFFSLLPEPREMHFEPMGCCTVCGLLCRVYKGYLES